MDFHYRMAKETDKAAILALYLAEGWWDKDDERDPLYTISGVIANSLCFVVAEADEEIIGMGRAISDGFTDAYIQDLMVVEGYRGRGVGKGIVQCILEDLKKRNLQWIGLISEPGYESFYQSLGFKVMQGYTPFLLDI